MLFFNAILTSYHINLRLQSQEVTNPQVFVQPQHPLPSLVRKGNYSQGFDYNSILRELQDKDSLNLSLQTIILLNEMEKIKKELICKQLEFFNSVFYCKQIFKEDFLFEAKDIDCLKNLTFFIFSYLLFPYKPTKGEKKIKQKYSIQKISESIIVNFFNGSMHNVKVLAIALKVFTNNFNFMYFDGRDMSEGSISIKKIYENELNYGFNSHEKLYTIAFLLSFIDEVVKVRQITPNKELLTFQDVFSIITNEHYAKLFKFGKRTPTELAMLLKKEFTAFNLQFKTFIQMILDYLRQNKLKVKYINQLLR